MIFVILLFIIIFYDFFSQKKKKIWSALYLACLIIVTLVSSKINYNFVYMDMLLK